MWFCNPGTLNFCKRVQQEQITYLEKSNSGLSFFAQFSQMEQGAKSFTILVFVKRRHFVAMNILRQNDLQICIDVRPLYAEMEHFKQANSHFFKGNPYLSSSNLEKPPTGYLKLENWKNQVEINRWNDFLPHLAHMYKILL